MKKRNFLFLMIVFTVKVAFCQVYEMKKELTLKEKTALLDMGKQLFKIDANISYSISTSDITSSISDMNEDSLSDPSYLKKTQDLLKKDSLNPVLLSNLGEFYRRKGNSFLSKKYFQKSYDNLALRYFENDSAYFYSFRGILKYNLGLENGIQDIENSLRKNPNDSIAISFYPMFLLKNGRFDEGKKFCTKALDIKSQYPEAPFVYLILMSFFERFQELIAEVNSNKELKKSYREIDYNVLIDFSDVNKYAALYKDNLRIQNANKIKDLLGLMVKLAVFEMKEQEEVVLDYTSQEIIVMKSIEKWLIESLSNKTLNEYTANKSLGFVSFLLNNKEKSIAYYKKAIELFPEEKKSGVFNVSESFDTLLFICNQKKDSVVVKELLERKIEAAPEGKSAKDHIMLAQYYLLSDQLSKAEEWCKKAKDIDAANFDTLQLLTHLNFVKKRGPLVEFYGNEAATNAISDYQQYKIVMQFAIYRIYSGNVSAGVENINVGRKLLESSDCELCDQLMDTYVTEVDKG